METLKDFSSAIALDAEELLNLARDIEYSMNAIDGGYCPGSVTPNTAPVDPLPDSVASDLRGAKYLLNDLRVMLVTLQARVRQTGRESANNAQAVGLTSTDRAAFPGGVLRS